MREKLGEISQLAPLLHHTLKPEAWGKKSLEKSVPPQQQKLEANEAWNDSTKSRTSSFSSSYFPLQSQPVGWKKG